MNDTQLAKYIDSLNLYPHQATFALEVLQSETPAAFSLASPPGSGATTTALGIVNAGITSLRLRRVLHLSSRKATVMFAVARLRELSLDTQVVAVDRDYLIARESFSENEFWPENGIFVANISEAVRSRFEGRFVTVNWDLIVIADESISALDVSNEQFIQKIIDSQPIRLVLLGRKPDRNVLRNELQEYKHTTFTEKRIKDISWYRDKIYDQKLFKQSQRKVDWEIREYSLTQDEQDFFELLNGTISEIESRTNSKWRVPTTILERAMSCLFSVENTLLRLDQTLMNDILFSPNLVEMNENDRSFVQLFGPCIEKLDEISADSKSNALVELLRETDGKQVCVISRFADSIKFLEARMQEESGLGPIVLYAELEGEDIERRTRIVETGKNNLILTTDAALRGVDLSPDIVVHYDIPYRTQLLEIRIARFRKPGVTDPVRMVALVEEASVLKSLWEKQLEIARTLD